MGIRDPLRDEQEALSTAECDRCKGDIYVDVDQDEYGAVLCDRCRGELYEVDTVLAYAKAWPKRLLSFLEDQKSEDYMILALTIFRDFCEGDENGCPDYGKWARS